MLLEALLKSRDVAMHPLQRCHTSKDLLQCEVSKGGKPFSIFLVSKLLNSINSNEIVGLDVPQGILREVSLFHLTLLFFQPIYLSRFAYTFNLTLVGSSDPIIKRTFDVPCRFTFRQLHYTIQYAMGPWQCCHLHEFSFNKPLGSGPRVIDRLGYKDEKLKIVPKDLDGGGGGPDHMFAFLQAGDRPKPQTEMEETLKLKDVFDPAGRLHEVVAPDGEVYPLIYIYDFGVSLHPI